MKKTKIARAGKEPIIYLPLVVNMSRKELIMLLVLCLKLVIRIMYILIIEGREIGHAIDT